MMEISIVIETVTVRYDDDHGPVADAIAPAIAALGLQSLPRDRFEILVVLDPAVDAATLDELRRRYPDVRLVLDVEPNYFAEKNAGVAAARAPVVAWLDADCVPDPAWIESLLAPLRQGADLSTGRTRYEGGSLAAKTFSVPDFANVIDREGSATGIMLNNVALRRDLALAHPLDTRIRRNGGCYLLYHQLRAIGTRMVYVPEATVSHALDVAGLGFVRKHFDRGFDSVSVYRCDGTHALRGTRLFRRLGPIALAGITARRVAHDWRRLARERAQIGISPLALPYYAGVMALTRGIELAGGMTAMVRRKR